MNRRNVGILLMGLALLLGVGTGATVAVREYLPAVIGEATGSAPFACKGLHVLITYDGNNKAGIPAGQRDAVDSGALRVWLTSHCAKDSTGRPAWRIEPEGTVFGSDQPTWKAAMAVPRSESQWLVISTGKSGVSMPLPKSEADLTKILAKYGGT